MGIDFVGNSFLSPALSLSHSLPELSPNILNISNIYIFKVIRFEHTKKRRKEKRNINAVQLNNVH